MVFVFSCDVKDNEVSPEESFTKFYDKPEFEHEFFPLDIKQTSDGGYLMLSSYNVYSIKEIHVMKVSQDGDLEWEEILHRYQAHL